MKPGMKMYMMSRDAESRSRNYGNRMEMDAESKFRDRRGREHYDNGRYAPRNEMNDMDYRMGHDMEDMERGPESYDMESRYGARSNYGPESRRYKNGRFAPKSEEMNYPFVPPVYERGGDMNTIGFALNNNHEIGGDYRSDAAYSHMDEMGRRSSKMESGGAKGRSESFTEEMAEEWMDGLKNEDGTKGPHWTLEQIKLLMAEKGVKCDPLRLWVAMNAEYSDRSAVNKKHGVNSADFYLDSAIAFWLKDKDAVEDKEAAYFMHVVK